ncbi:MAG TPA: hypothetical protein PL037_08740, partial [Elusimicrobiales bacterium]|nr:hypothetical protein [Elusimicrobiales bacterium]
MPEAAAAKSGGRLTVSDDIIGAPAGNIAMAGGNFLAQGFIGAVDSGVHSGPGAVVESGFYSYLVTLPSVYRSTAASEDSFLLDWVASNPAGTQYTVFLSTYAGTNPYLTLLSTPAYASGFFGLGVNTTYYAYMQPNYMESDFPGQIAFSTVTLSSGVFENAMALGDVGPRSAEFHYPNLHNPGAVFNVPWTEASQSVLPRALYGQGSALYENFIYAGGGHDGVTFSSAVYYARLDAGGSWTSWSTAGYLPSPRYGLVLLALKGRLYALGGYNAAGASALVWSADISTSGTLGAWRTEPALPGGRYLHAASEYKGRIYVSGGYRTSAPAGAELSVLKADAGD